MCVGGGGGGGQGGGGLRGGNYFAIFVDHVVRGASDDLCFKHAQQCHSQKKRSLVYLLIVKLFDFDSS